MKDLRRVVDRQRKKSPPGHAAAKKAKAILEVCFSNPTVGGSIPPPRWASFTGATLDDLIGSLPTLQF